MANQKNLFNKRLNCPACEHNESTEIINLEWNDKVLTDLFRYRNYPIDFINEESYVILECLNCSLLYQKFCPNDFLLDKIYNKWLKGRNSKENNFHDHSFIPYSSERTIGNISEINQSLNKIIDFSDKPKVLDFGMGWGGWCKSAQLMGLEAYGAEITKSQISYNKRNGLKVIEWAELPNYSFDFINTEQVFEHLAEPYKVLEHLVKCLKPNGFLKISVPNSIRVKSNLKKDFKSEWFYAKGKKHSINHVEPLQHLNGFTNHSLDIMASKLGLKRSNILVGPIQTYSVSSSSMLNSLIYFFNPFLPIYNYINFNRTKGLNVIFKKGSD